MLHGKKIRKYTLIELLMTVAILCVLVTLTVVLYNNVHTHWATTNTVAAMKQVELAFDKFRQQNGYFPKSEHYDSTNNQMVLGMAAVSWKTQGNSDKNIDLLAADLLQISPLAEEKDIYGHDASNQVTVFDAFKHQETHPLYYFYPYKNGTSDETGTFALFSKGEDGEWDTGDEIVLLPNGIPGKKMPPGFYRSRISEGGSLSLDEDDLESLAK